MSVPIWTLVSTDGVRPLWSFSFAIPYVRTKCCRRHALAPASYAALKYPTTSRSGLGNSIGSFCVALVIVKGGGMGLLKKFRLSLGQMGHKMA